MSSYTDITFKVEWNEEGLQRLCEAISRDVGIWELQHQHWQGQMRLAGFHDLEPHEHVAWIAAWGCMPNAIRSATERAREKREWMKRTGQTPPPFEWLLPSSAIPNGLPKRKA